MMVWYVLHIGSVVVSVPSRFHFVTVAAGNAALHSRHKDKDLCL